MRLGQHWTVVLSSSSRRWRMVSRSVSSSGQYPRLESATGRARKRRGRMAAAARQQKPLLMDFYTTPKKEQPSQPSSSSEIKSWHVLWPNPYPEDDSRNFRIPRPREFRDAWVQYKETWEDGLKGAPKEETAVDTTTTSITTLPQNNNYQQQVGMNLSRNIDTAQSDAQQLLQKAKDNTGIHNQDDLRSLASSTMQLATECLKEFMVGYRKGRDEEVDNMLNDYFQNNMEDEQKQETAKRRRRKPKRAILRE